MGLLNGFAQKNLEDEKLLSQINEALQEEQLLWHKEEVFVDATSIEQYQNKWQSVYYLAKKTTSKKVFLRKAARTLRAKSVRFIATYETLSVKQEKHNNRIIERKVQNAARLIFPVEGKKLDAQQLQCIVKDSRNHLVLAGAGTGKTTTIIGFVKYLLKSNLCNAEDILLLSFTNASANEMKQRLEAELNEPIAASTFHKLGLDIITAVQGKKPNIFADDTRQIVRKYLEELTQSDDYLKRLCDYLVFNGTNQKSEFDFKTEEEYQAFLQYNPPVTLKKETVKSYGELDIANYLYQNGITYEYEKDYLVDTRTTEYGQYYPDFYLPDYGIYIEYFGVDRQGSVPPYFKGKGRLSAAMAYQAGMEWKRNLHRQNGTTLLELYAYEKLEEQLLPRLEEQLKNAGVALKPIDPKNLWAAISGSANQKLDRVAEQFSTAINLIKSNSWTIERVRELNKQRNHLADVDAALNLIQPIFNQYQNELQRSGKIDFNDMINIAAELVRNGQFKHNYRYVIVDEYQDISQARYRLLWEMRQKKDYRLFCVGDDWQSIYRFAGSDIGFILNFEKHWGLSDISRIETTYRFSQSLIAVSSSFIMKNPEQRKKNLRSVARDNHFAVEKITGYTEATCIEFLAERLRDLPQNSSVLFLGRYRFDVKMLDKQAGFSCQYNAATGRTDVSFSQHPDLKISFMTIHSSKGLQADYVFLLNNKLYGMGFPSQLSDAPVIQLLLDACDYYPFAEERRLFYVALTRAKKKVWLVTVKGNESAFVQEVEAGYGDAMYKEQYTCPLCGGHLVRRSGPYGDFFGCSNYKETGCRYKRKIKSQTVSNSN